MNLLQVEIWSSKSIKKDSLIGLCEIPINNSLIGTTTKHSHTIHTFKDKERGVGEVTLKLRLEPMV